MELNMEAELPPLEDTPRLTNTINRMIGILTNNGYSNRLPGLPEQGVAEWMQMLETNILEEMRAWIANPQMNRLETIFHRVQCWGGSSGRSIYVMGGGFENNFNLEAYEGIASTIANNEVGDNYQNICQTLFGYVNNIGRFGISFATKHFCFWSRAAESPLYLPIYDQILAREIMGVQQPRQQDYPTYCQNLIRYAQLNGVTPYTAERHLFNHFAG